MTSGTDPGSLASAADARGRGALVEAREAAERAVERDPAEPRAWLMRGSIAHLEGRLAAALADYRRALAAAPRDAAAHAALAVALAQHGQRATARAHLAAALDRRASGGLGEVAWLRAFRQLRELAADGATLAWACCATPLLRPGVEPERTCLPGQAGRRTWTPAELVAALRSRPRVVALTGAGLSAASGLCTRKELWRRFDRDEAVSAVGFRERPAALWAAIRAFWGAGGHAPNSAHMALATWPDLQAIVTQNVDGLHQAAGGPAPVIELHGALDRTRCVACGRGGAAASALAGCEPLPPRCGACGGPLRPEVVLFGEPVPGEAWAEARRVAAAAELLLVVGCAMDVSPASELPLIAARAGATIVEIKRRPSRLSDAVTVHHVAGAAEDVLPWVRAALEERG